MAWVRIHPALATAAGAQVVLLTALSGRAGLGLAGWLGGAASLVGLWALLTAAARRAGRDTPAPP